MCPPCGPNRVNENTYMEIKRKNTHYVTLLQLPPLPVLQYIHQSILWARLCSKTSFPRNSISLLSEVNILGGAMMI